jgi:hypothetical protein
VIAYEPAESEERCARDPDEREVMIWGVVVLFVSCMDEDECIGRN